MHILDSWWFSLWIAVLRGNEVKHQESSGSLRHHHHAGRSLAYISPMNTPCIRSFFMPRDVEIRPVAWKKRGVELLQVYETTLAGEDADATQTHLRICAGDLMTALDQQSDRGIIPLARGVDAFFGKETKQSRSAQAGLEQWPHISRPKEKLRLCSKLLAEFRAQQPLDPLLHLNVLYLDEHICVVVKPSGILSVPGVQRNPSLLDLVFDLLQPSDLDTMDQMVVHRLDMDTSGIVVFALSKKVAKQLHGDFRERNVHKEYEALLSGWIGAATPEVDIQLDLERDPHHIPFMRIAQPRDKPASSSAETMIPFLKQLPKPSWTELRVLDRTTIGNACPVTRVQLIAHTGRTHQLRVHTAALGYPILGDDVYGYRDDAEGNAGGVTPSKEQMEFYNALPTGRLCLHARRLALRHPVSREPMLFVCQAPF